MLNEAVMELKIEEFSDIYKEEGTTSVASLPVVIDCQVETDMELTFPSDYVENVSERMSLYRELDNVKDEAELLNFEAKMRDRFGDLPEQTKNLLTLVRVRWMAQRLGFEKLTLKQGRMVGYFVSEEKSPYFQTDAFGKILEYFQTHVERCKLRDNAGKRSIVFSEVQTVAEAYEVLTSVENMKIRA